MPSLEEQYEVDKKYFKRLPPGEKLEQWWSADAGGNQSDTGARKNTKIQDDAPGGSHMYTPKGEPQKGKSKYGIAGSEQADQMGGGQYAQTGKDVAKGPFKAATNLPGPLDSSGSEGGPTEVAANQVPSFDPVTGLPTTDQLQAGLDTGTSTYIGDDGLPITYDNPTAYSELDVFNAELAKYQTELQGQRFEEDLRLNQERHAFELKRFELDEELARAQDLRDTAAQNQDKTAFEAAQRQVLGIERERQKIEKDIETARVTEQTRQFNADLAERTGERDRKTLEDQNRYNLSVLQFNEQKELDDEKYKFETDYITRRNELENARIEFENAHIDAQDALNVTIAANRVTADKDADDTDNAIAIGNWAVAREGQAKQTTAQELNRGLELTLQSNQHKLERDLFTNQKEEAILDRNYQAGQTAFQTKEFEQMITRNTRAFEEQVRQFDILHSAQQFTEDKRQFDERQIDIDLDRSQQQAQFSRQQGLEELKYQGELARDPGSFLQSANLQRGLPLGTPPQGLTNVAGATGGAESVQLPPALEALRTGAGDTGALQTPDTGLGTPSIQQIGQLGPDEQQALFGLIESLGISQEDFVRMIQQTAPSQQTNVLTAA